MESYIRATVEIFRQSSAMAQTTDTEIRELKELILGLDRKIDALDTKVEVFTARTEERFNSIDQRFDSVDQRIDSLDKSLNKRIDPLEQRANGQETRFWSLVAILATSLLGIIGKVVFFPVDRL